MFNNFISKKKEKILNRFFDIFFALIFLILLLPIIILTSILIKIDSKGPIFFLSNRVGKKNKLFKMIKFRSMKTNTKIIETSKLEEPFQNITKIGKILRRFSIDEIPQFFCVLKGDMSIVGPRPALSSQISLINKRKKYGIDKLKPGITGYAQINGRDLISDQKKIEFELEYLNHKSLALDLKILYKTIFIVLNKKGVSH